MTGTREEPALRWPVLLLVCTAQLMCVLDDTIVNVALPSIQDGLGFADANLPWIVNGYLVTFGGLLLLAGRACDLFVRRAVFVAGLVTFGVGSLAGGLATSPVVLLVARAVQGVGAAFLSAAALAILTSTFTGPDRHRAFGVWGGVSGLAGTLGVLLGGVLTSWLSWRWIFLVNVPVVLAVVVLVPRFVAGGRATERGRLDPLGGLLGTAGLAVLMVAIVRTEHVGWGSVDTLVGLLGAAACLGAFIAVEARHRAPLLPLAVFGRRNVVGGVVCGLALSGAMLAMFFVLTLYLQRVLHYTALETGLAYLPISLSVILAARLAGPLIARHGARPPLAVGFALIAAAMVWFGRLDVDTGYLQGVLGPAVVAGLGLGTTLVCVVATLTRDLDGPDESGLASGLVGTTQQLGGALGVASLSTIAFARADAAGPTTSAEVASALTEGFRDAFHTAAGIAAVGLVVALLVTGARVGRGADPEHPRTGAT